jgi:hypothetical protein
MVTQIQRTIARRPVLDLAIRALAIALLALVILVGLPVIVTPGS